MNLSDCDYCITVSFLELLILTNPLIFHPHMTFKTKHDRTTHGKRNLASVSILISPRSFAIPRSFLSAGELGSEAEVRHRALQEQAETEG